VPASTARSMSPSSGGGVGLQFAADLETRQFRHHDVQQDQVGLGIGHAVERFLAVKGCDHAAAQFVEVRLEEFYVLLGVVRDEDRRVPDFMVDVVGHG
jgi:hypothetical protein